MKARRCIAASSSTATRRASANAFTASVPLTKVSDLEALYAAVEGGVPLTLYGAGFKDGCRLFVRFSMPHAPPQTLC